MVKHFRIYELHGTLSQKTVTVNSHDNEKFKVQSQWELYNPRDTEFS
jgi:hypothetical protein